jgi:hypothetical protein
MAGDSPILGNLLVAASESSDAFSSITYGAGDEILHVPTMLHGQILGLIHLFSSPKLPTKAIKLRLESSDSGFDPTSFLDKITPTPKN